MHGKEKTPAELLKEHQDEYRTVLDTINETRTQLDLLQTRAVEIQGAVKVLQTILAQEKIHAQPSDATS